MFHARAVFKVVYPLHDRGRHPLSLNGVSAREGGNYRIHYNAQHLSEINDIESIFCSSDVCQDI